MHTEINDKEKNITPFALWRTDEKNFGIYFSIFFFHFAVRVLG